MHACRQTLILARHGATEWSAEGRHTGQRDVGLSRTGVQQARALADRLGAIATVEVLLTSDLRRAHHTACIVARRCHVDAITDIRLREESLGEWEGLTTEQIRQRFPLEYRDWRHGNLASTANREGMPSVRRRAMAALEDTLNSESPRTLCVVTHVNVIHALFQGLGIAGDCPDVQPGCFITVKGKDGSWSRSVT